MKIATILACTALGLGGCTGPGLEPPFDGEHSDAASTHEPNGGGDGTTAENVSDAGPSDPDPGRDADAGSEDD